MSPVKFFRLLVAFLICILVQSAGSSAQKQPRAGSVTGVQEFQVVFESSVTSGKTPAGTKIKARLSMATLLNGTVVPRNAKFSGEVVLSQAKTSNGPSLLSVRMDSVSWKNGSIPVRVFLTEWFSRHRWKPRPEPAIWTCALERLGVSSAGRAQRTAPVTSGKDEGCGYRTCQRWRDHIGL